LPTLSYSIFITIDEGLKEEEKPPWSSMNMLKKYFGKKVGM
jgi:hypothetical protein